MSWSNGIKHNFEVRARAGTSGNWTKILNRTDSTSNNNDIEVYNVTDFDARQVRLKIFSAVDRTVANVSEFEVYGTGGTSSSSSTSSTSSGFNLNANANFDLSHWKLDTPASRSSSDECKTQVTEPEDWQNGNVADGQDGFENSSKPYFFTHTDGGMRFVSEVDGATTGGSCSSRTRSELRELVAGADDSIGDSDYRNNWALEYQPTTSASGEEQWGGRGGKMTATLRVNQVTTTGGSAGRTVIEQIHAEGNEPLRLNYKHIEGTDRGCIYAASEERPDDGDEINYALIGSTGYGSEPDDGIELNELFSYEIENIGSDLRVIILRGDSNGTEINRVTIPLNNAGYNVNNDFMYFKAGAYTN